MSVSPLFVIDTNFNLKTSREHYVGGIYIRKGARLHLGDTHTIPPNSVRTAFAVIKGCGCLHIHWGIPPKGTVVTRFLFQTGPNQWRAGEDCLPSGVGGNALRRLDQFDGGITHD